MASQSWVQVRLDQNHMNTTFELQVSCEEGRARLAERVLLEAHAKIAALEKELSEFHPESPVYKLNQAKAFERVPANHSVRELLELSESLRRASGGDFHPLCKSREAGGAVLFADDRVHFFKTK